MSPKISFTFRLFSQRRCNRSRFGSARLGTAAALVALTAATDFSPAAHAWNAVGHMTIGAIAEARLNEHAKREIARLLPLVADPRSPNFMTAGVWMDDIRGDDVRLFDRWHYDNLGNSPDGTPLGARHLDNVAWAIEVNTGVLKSQRASDAEKARALRFLIHTVEDAHNPFHTGSRFTKELPDGDSGGNRFLLGYPEGEGPRNLHALWDGALGTFRGDAPIRQPEGNRQPNEARQPNSNRRPDQPRTPEELRAQGEERLKSEARLRALGTDLTVKYPENSLPQSAELDPQKWVAEGSALLQQQLYPTTTPPDAAYLERCRPIAERQATLAGYRLARLLNSIWP